MLRAEQAEGVLRTSLASVFGRFKLWAHGFDASPGQSDDNLGVIGSQLDDVLGRSDYLRGPTIRLLLSFASCLFSSQFREISDDDTRIRLDEALQAILDIYPDSEEVFFDFSSDQSEGSAVGELHDIIDSLFQLAPSLDGLLKAIPAPTEPSVSPITDSYRKLIFDKFPDASRQLALRLAKGNAECHEKVRAQAEESQMELAGPEVSAYTTTIGNTYAKVSDDGPGSHAPSTITSYAQATTFHDSGIGGSHHFTPSLERKRALFDTRPYVCIFEDCDQERKSFASQEEWITHQKSHKPLNEYEFSAETCPFCWKKLAPQTKFYSHVCYHMEEIRLLALPLSYRQLDDLGPDPIAGEEKSLGVGAADPFREQLETRRISGRQRVVGDWIANGELAVAPAMENHSNMAQGSGFRLGAPGNNTSADVEHFPSTDLLNGGLSYGTANPSVDTRSKFGVPKLLGSAIETIDTIDRGRILEWISNIRFDEHHEHARERREPGTGSWLFNNPHFGAWKGSSSSSLLWCYGIPGVGKTILSSSVIEYLKKTSLGDTNIAYFYCNAFEKPRWDATAILGSLLKQVSAGLGSLDPNLVSLFEESRLLNFATSLDFYAVEALFTAALGRFREVFLVVDALDECGEEARERLLMQFSHQLARRDHRVKIFATSRYMADVEHLVKQMPSSICSIGADDVLCDITVFTTVRVKEMVRSLQLSVRDASLVDEVIDAIRYGANGMFLWAELQIRSLHNSNKGSDLREFLNDLPRDLDATYGRIWRHIQESPDDQKGLALTTLAWVLFAKNPLTWEALLEATAINESDSTFHRDHMASFVGYLAAAYTDFIALDNTQQVVRILHYSVAEFLRRKPEFASTHDMLAANCLIALSLTDSELSDNGIYPHAALNWEKYVERWDYIDVKRDELLRRFLYNSASVRKWVSFRKSHDSRFDYYLSPIADPTALCLVTYFELPVVLRHLLQDESQNPAQTMNLSSLLFLAAACGNLAASRLLIEYGADVNLTESGNILQAAAYGGHLAIVALLLDRGAGANDRGGEYESALQAAAHRGNQAVVELLLDRGANINFSAGGVDALQVAASRGHEELVQLLLERDADIKAQEGKYESALQVAAYRGHLGVVEQLLDRNVNVNGRGRYGTALYAATCGGQLAVVGLLLGRGADVDLQEGENGNALQAASYLGHLAIVELLLEWGADVNIQGGRNGTALQAAAYGGHRVIVELLLEWGADVNIQGGGDWSALQAAAYAGHQAIVDLLLEWGADANIRGGRNDRALQAVYASKNRETLNL